MKLRTDVVRRFRPLHLPMIVVVLSLAVLVTSVPRSLACPFCLGSQPLTLRERMDTPDAALLVKWVSGDVGNIDQNVPASTTFDILQVKRGDFQVGESFTIDRYQDGKPGERFLISGNAVDDLITWDRAIPLAEKGWHYINSLPSSEASSSDRLRHALQHLESEDDMVATDAFGVIAGSKYEELRAMRDDLPREKLRQWVFSGQPIKGQLGVYGMLLGICGDETDRQQLEALALATTGEVRLGIDGVMGGYLLLSGEEGLDVLDKAFLMKESCARSDRYAVMQALSFIWEYGDGCITKERLRASARGQLQITDMPELLIADLARWEDWSVTDKLIARYENPPDKLTDRAIVSFLIVASQVDPESVVMEDTESIAQAREFVERLQQERPAEHKRASRLLITR